MPSYLPPVRMPLSMKPWFAKRVAIALTAPFPTYVHNLVATLHKSLATPDEAYFQYEERSPISKQKRHCLVTLVYGKRTYHFVYEVNRLGHACVPVYTALNLHNYHWQAAKHHVPMRPSLLDRILRYFAFRENNYGKRPHHAGRTD